MSMDNPLANLPDIASSINVQLTFDPNINDMIIRLTELKRAIAFLEDEKDLNKDFQEALLDNLIEEFQFCNNKLQQAYDNLPSEEEITKSSSHPNPILEDEDDPFTEVIEVKDETPPVKRKAPRKRKSPKK